MKTEVFSWQISSWKSVLGVLGSIIMDLYENRNISFEVLKSLVFWDPDFSAIFMWVQDPSKWGYLYFEIMAHIFPCSTGNFPLKWWYKSLRYVSIFYSDQWNRCYVVIWILCKREPWIMMPSTKALIPAHTYKFFLFFTEILE